jgi:hypothetical protein
MPKLRIVDGIPEVDGNPAELAEFLRSLSASGSVAVDKISILRSKESAEAKPMHIPTADELVAYIEERGRPFNFSMAEYQIQSYGNIISSKTDRYNYEKLYMEFRKAMKIMLKKYGGKWDFEVDEKMEGLEGKYYKRYTLIENLG